MHVLSTLGDTSLARLSKLNTLRPGIPLRYGRHTVMNQSLNSSISNHTYPNILDNKLVFSQQVLNFLKILVTIKSFFKLYLTISHNRHPVRLHYWSVYKQENIIDDLFNIPGGWKHTILADRSECPKVACSPKLSI